MVARMMNAHRQVILASDPYSRLFKAFRNEVALQVLRQKDFDLSSPLDDYYYYPDKQRFFQAVQKTSLDLSVPGACLPALRENIAHASKAFSPMIADHLNRLKGKTFRDLFTNAFDIVERAYKKPKASWIGIKEVWVGEFASHFLNAFKTLKVIHIVRDPRAVCASNQVTREKYPFFFLARQWRKLAAVAWMNLTAVPERVMILQYEKLIADPQEQCRRICRFLGVNLDPDMLNPALYVDGQGKPWLQNSSHYEGSRGFNAESVARWKQVLTADQIEFIEIACQGEMRLFGYNPIENPMRVLPLSAVFNPLKLNPTEIADWIKPYVPPHQSAFMQEAAMDLACSLVLAENRPIDRQRQKQLFLDEGVYKAICQR
jgi:hypothetical protein